MWFDSKQFEPCPEISAKFQISGRVSQLLLSETRPGISTKFPDQVLGLHPLLGNYGAILRRSHRGYSRPGDKTQRGKIHFHKIRTSMDARFHRNTSVTCRGDKREKQMKGWKYEVNPASPDILYRGEAIITDIRLNAEVHP